jgi:predicted amidohydrolase YtcJ
VTSFLLCRVRLVDIDGTGPGTEPVDVRVMAGQVTAVGEHLSDDGLPRVEADGRWLSPGLWDQHVHLGQWSLSSSRLDLAPARSAEHAVGMVRERLAELPDRPVVGWGHRPSGWPEPPVVSMLDVLGTDQPVILIAGDGHHAWLNSRALMALHLPSREGVVAEAEWFGAYGRLGSVLGDDGTGPEAYRRAMEQAARLGVVGLTDFEFSGGHEEWTERWAAGADLLRIRMATYADGLDAVIAAGLRTGDPLPGCDGRARMGPLKIISDGSLNTATAWCCEPYAGPSPYGFPHGQPNQSPEELRDLLRRGTAHGLKVAVHAIGDRAVGEALDAFEETGARGSVEHAQLVRRDDVRRMAALGVTASVQPAHLLDDRDGVRHRPRRTFAVISHPDAGKSTLTEALALHARVITEAGAVHGKGDRRRPPSRTGWTWRRPAASRSPRPRCSSTTATTSSTSSTPPATATSPRTPTACCPPSTRP